MLFGAFCYIIKPRFFISEIQEEAMNQNVKKTIFTVIYAMAAFAAVVGIFALVVNAVELLLYTPYYNGHSVSNAYWRVQFVGAVFCILAAVVSIAVFLLQFFLVRKKVPFELGALIRYGLMLLLLVFVIIHFICFLSYKKPQGVPINASSSTFSIYSAVKALLIEQFVYFLIMAAIEIGAFLLKKKEEEADSRSVLLETPSESAAAAPANDSEPEQSIPSLLSPDASDSETAAPFQGQTESNRTKPV